VLLLAMDSLKAFGVLGLHCVPVIVGLEDLLSLFLLLFPFSQ